MKLSNLATALVVASALSMSTDGQGAVQASPVPAPATSSSNGAAALLGLAAIGLFVMVVTGSKTPTGGTVTKNGGKINGSFPLLKF